LWFGDGENITPIHFDAVDNFVVPIFGEKTFYLYPTSKTHFIYPHSISSKGRFNFCEITGCFLSDRKQYTLLEKAKCYKVTIKPGNILYIPVGWLHEVHTHKERGASITSFFNTGQYRCLLWYFLGYQSCRLHEIKRDVAAQEVLYHTNYGNGFYSAYKLIGMNQCWLVAILAGAALESAIMLSISGGYKFLFDVIVEQAKSSICTSLIQNKNWLDWKQIIELAMTEDNNKLVSYDLTKFISEIQEFIINNVKLEKA